MCFFFNDTATNEIYTYGHTLSLHYALPIFIIVMLENKVGEFGLFLSQVTGVQWFQVLGESVTIVIGLIFIICVMAFRRGIIGELIYRFKKTYAGIGHNRCFDHLAENQPAPQHV